MYKWHKSLLVCGFIPVEKNAFTKIGHHKSVKGYNIQAIS